jgi:membrane carboxypeptidase/penicillin-binding protein
VGYTPELLTVVWVGFDSKRPLGLPGARGALPIWVDFMKRATAAFPSNDFTPPPNIRFARIDPESGALATENCPETLVEAFYADQVPQGLCPLHSLPPADLPTGEPH